MEVMLPPDLNLIIFDYWLYRIPPADQNKARFGGKTAKRAAPLISQSRETSTASDYAAATKTARTMARYGAGVREREREV